MGASSGRKQSKPMKTHLTFFTIIVAADRNW